MFLYSLTKFGNFKRWTNIQWLRNFDLSFWETSKQIYRKLQYRKKVFESLKVCLAFPEIWFCICWPKFWAFCQCSVSQKIQLKFFTGFKIYLWETLTWGETIWKVSRFGLLYQKNSFVFVDQIRQFPALIQYFMAQKTHYRLLRYFLINL